MVSAPEFFGENSPTSATFPSRLVRHRKLAPNAGLHVAPIALGAMSIGDQWEKYGMGAMDKESSFRLMDAYYEAGGNFIDTANVYQDDASEMFIGEWMEMRGNRDQMVIATKYSSNYKRNVPLSKLPQKTPYVGNNFKSMVLSVEDSLKKLRTSYIDIFYVHWWDYKTPVEEIMNGLHNLVVQGKVLYLGISDTPAWVVTQCNAYARQHGKTPFVIYQGAWSVLQRDLERDIIPMCISEGMAICPWNVLHGGRIRTDEEEQQRIESGEGGRSFLVGDEWKRTEDQRKVCLELEKVAKEVGARSITSVAIAWVMQKVPYVFPIVGGRKVKHLYANLEALEISLSPQQIKDLENVVPFVKGFPYDFIGDGEDYIPLQTSAGPFEKWPSPQAIRPSDSPTKLFP